MSLVNRILKLVEGCSSPLAAAYVMAYAQRKLPNLTIDTEEGLALATGTIATMMAIDESCADTVLGWITPEYPGAVYCSTGIEDGKIKCRILTDMLHKTVDITNHITDYWEAIHED